jgi:hypothetical protein
MATNEGRIKDTAAAQIQEKGASSVLGSQFWAVVLHPLAFCLLPSAFALARVNTGCQTGERPSTMAMRQISLISLIIATSTAPDHAIPTLARC